MDVESEVCSLELSKKLEELGVDHDALFYYLNIDGEGKYYVYYNEDMPEDYEYEGVPISAFTSAELGKLLPFLIEWQNHTCYLGSMFGYTKFGYTANVHYHYHDGEDIIAFDFADENEANARAQMLIYLIENKLMEIK